MKPQWFSSSSITSTDTATMAMISCHYKITSSRGQSSSTGKGKKCKCKKTNGLSPPLCLWTNDTGDDLQWNVNPIIIIITMCSSTSVASFGVRGLTFNTNSFLAHDVFLVSRDKSVDNSNCSGHVQPPTHDDVSGHWNLRSCGMSSSTELQNQCTLVTTWN